MSSSKKKQLRKEQYMTERQVAAAKEAKKMKTYTLTFFVVIALVVCIFIGAVVTNPIKNVIYKNTDAVVIGDYTLSSADVNYFYIDAVNNYINQYSDYIQYIIDVNKPLNEQVINKETGETWADSFLESAKKTIQSTYALYEMAVKDGHKLTEDEQKTLDSTIATRQLYAAYYGYNNMDAYLRAMYGHGASEKGYRNYLEVSALANSYLTAYSESLEFDADDLLDYQAKEPYKYNAYTFATYLVSASSYREGGTKDDKGNITYTEEEKAAAIKAAEEAANALANGEYADLEAFDAAIKAMPINKLSLTAASTKNEDVLYTEVATRFQNWLIGKVESEDKDAEPTFETRKEGDITVIPYTSGTGENEVINGYYVIRFGSVNTNEFSMKNVRHLLVKFEGGKTDSTTGVVTYSDAEKAKAKAEAEKLLAEWEKGDKSENSFAELAKKESDDNKEAGGLYENVYPGQMVTAFNDWCYDADRVAGDYGIVETEYGYHLMFFVGNTEQTFRDFLITSVMRSEAVETWYNGLVEAAKLTVLTTKHIDLDMVLGH
jgi:parvulin-like peptidyl-prolyl isomerase